MSGFQGKMLESQTKKTFRTKDFSLNMCYRLLLSIGYINQHGPYVTHQPVGRTHPSTSAYKELIRNKKKKPSI